MDRCLAFTPLNGLGAALLAAASKPAVTLPASVTIDTSTGVVKDSGGAAVPFDSIVLTQAGAPDIRAYIGQAIDMTGVVISGSKAVAFVATGDITLHGLVDISATGTVAGAGAMETGSCTGSVATTGGGGGNGTDGGVGASSTDISGIHAGGAGGKTVMNYEPLFGGCRGGSTNGMGGAGGGAMQMVSGTRISFDTSAITDLGGGGAGGDAIGGGAGGTIILESPIVAINGAVVANGGAGGACGTTAADGTRTTAAAIGSSCGTNSSSRAGSGGTRTTAATGGVTLTPTGNAGGGGAVGRLLVRTQDGNYAAGGSSLVSALVVTQQLPTQ
jgi:hypothetical protein